MGGIREIWIELTDRQTWRAAAGLMTDALEAFPDDPADEWIATAKADVTSMWNRLRFHNDFILATQSDHHGGEVALYEFCRYLFLREIKRGNHAEFFGSLLEGKTEMSAQLLNEVTDWILGNNEYLDDRTNQPEDKK